MRLLSQMPQDQSSSPSGGHAAAVPLAGLHKMSTTAGLGSTDYVAVNATAIFALIMGFASALTLFNEPILLLIPLVGMIAAIVAYRQIGKSNQTQTGRGLAALALVLCLGFGGVVFASTVSGNVRQRADLASIDKLITKLGENIQQGKFDDAYQMFDDRFRARVKVATFSDLMKVLRENPTYGKLQNVTWKHLAAFETDQTTGTRMAAVNVIFNYDKVGEVRQTAIFRKVEGDWALSDIPAYFPTAKAGEQP
jgi:hypothetical protein